MWQDRSGRAVADEDGRLGGWWATVNWALTMWQLEALQRRGELVEVVLAEKPLPLPDAVAAHILAYYDRLDALKGADRGQEAELQRLLWAFHVRAIERGLEAAAPRLASLPEAEVRFAEAWGCFVGLLAAINFSTDFDSATAMQALLPARLLAAGDWDPAAPSDLTDARRRTLIAMRALYDAERADGHALARLLQACARTEDGARAATSHLLEALVFGGAEAASFLRARLAQAPGAM
jgi:hypothetical protein